MTRADALRLKKETKIIATGAISPASRTELLWEPFPQPRVVEVILVESHRIIAMQGDNKVIYVPFQAAELLPDTVLLSIPVPRLQELNSIWKVAPPNTPSPRPHA